MEKNRWKKISQAFDFALTMPVKERTSYLKKICEGDPELLQEMLQLFNSLEESDDFLEEYFEKNQILLDDFATHLENSDANYIRFESLEDKTIGGWKLKKLLAHGGMGSVYKAIRTSSGIQQTGAFKIMHQNLNTPENVRRFKLEQQILANLNHPNIAGLIDGGVSQGGLPYLVMEYIEGKPIVEYCDENRLKIDQRLKLFLKVCEAVGHAHKNLIVHRDLKPDNILVTEEEHIQILDFGIAKLLNPELYTLPAAETRVGTRLMSLRYASPEQICGKPITTSTDIYALGVLLYELLAGIHPFNIEGSSYHETTQLIKNSVVPVPSKRLKKLSEGRLRVIAHCRSIHPDVLIKKVRGDLDSIIKKALRKEAESRYDTTEQLKNDINFYLQNKPVLARGEAFKYRFTKFIARNRIVIYTSFVFIVSVTFLITFYTYQLAQERDTAQLEAQTATQVSDFLISLFDASTPEFAQGDTITAEMLLSNGLKQINTLQDQPRLQARMLNNIGSAYQELELYDKAEETLQEALFLRKKHSAPNSIEIANSLISLGLLKRHQGNYAEAESLYVKALSIQKKELGNRHTAVASTLNNLGVIYRRKGLYDKAIQYYTHALNIWANADDLDHLEVAKTKQNMGAVLLEQEKFTQAKMIFEEALSMYIEHGGENHPMVATIILNLALVNKEQGNFEEAETLYRRALNIQNKVYGENSPETAITLNNLGILLAKNNRLSAAEPLLSKSLEIRRKLLGENHPEYVASLHNLAFLYQQNQHYTQADSIYRQTLKKWKKIVGSNHPNVAVTLNNLGAINKNLNNYSLAEKYFKEALQIRKETLSNDHPAVKRSYERLVELYSEWKKNELVASYADSAATIQ